MRKVAAAYDSKAPHVTITHDVEYRHWTFRYLLLHCLSLLTCHSLDALFHMQLVSRISWTICSLMGRERCLSRPMHRPAGSAHVKTYVLTVYSFCIMPTHSMTIPPLFVAHYDNQETPTRFDAYVWSIYSVWCSAGLSDTTRKTSLNHNISIPHPLHWFLLLHQYQQISSVKCRVALGHVDPRWPADQRTSSSSLLPHCDLYQR